MRIPSAIRFLPLFVFLSCGSDTPVRDSEELIIKNPRASECGGFPPASKRAADPDSSAVEKLSWTYNSGSGVLTVLNTGVKLNCCGVHSITAFRDGDAIVVSENDQPGDKGRCRCMCNYDFSVEIGGIASGAVEVRLELTVDDTLFRKWSGTIRPADGRGEIIVPKAE